MVHPPYITVLEILCAIALHGGGAGIEPSLGLPENTQLPICSHSVGWFCFYWWWPPEEFYLSTPVLTHGFHTSHTYYIHFILKAIIFPGRK